MAIIKIKFSAIQSPTLIYIGLLVVTNPHLYWLSPHLYWLTCRRSRLSSLTESQSDKTSKKLKDAEMNLYHTCLLLVLIFVLCWTNNVIVVMLYMLGVLENLSGTYYHVTVALVIFNSCLNPFVYAFRYKEFQNRLKEVFCRSFA